MKSVQRLLAAVGHQHNVYAAVGRQYNGSAADGAPSSDPCNDATGAKALKGGFAGGKKGCHGLKRFR